jgi:hypothetical protein
MYDRLAAVGLVTPRTPMATRLGEFLDGYIASRPDVKPRTKWNLEICDLIYRAAFSSKRCRPGCAFR